MATAAKKGYTVLTTHELNEMRARANLIETCNSFIDPANPNESKEAELYKMSQERTSNWNDNYKDLKKRKEEERFKKFEKEELERRRIDEEERAFQQVVKENELKKANAKLFQENERVRALNSKLLMSDTLQGREQQI